MNDKILAEAKRLHDLGFAIHWLHTKSKRPIESGWTTGPRKNWDELKQTYKSGFNVGVRLGDPSKIQNKFLGVIDVDIKSKDPKHNLEVNAALKTLNEHAAFPEVTSGRGNCSRHYYILTPNPVGPRKVFQSNEVVKVDMPSVKPSKRELKALTALEIEKGIRLRPAWEVALMGQGQQVVLPPSIHPDSGKAYAWQNAFETSKASKFNIALLPNVESPAVEKPLNKIETDSKPLDAFEVIPVDLSWVTIHPNILEMITTGKGVEDRSASLLPAASALLKAGLTKNEILSVLTDTKYYLGQTPFHHAQTENRTRAATWLWKYTVKKVFDENSAEKMFSDPIQDVVELSEVEIEQEQQAFEDLHQWESDLDRTEKGNYRATLKNVVMILQREIGTDLIKRDLFAYRDFYNIATPWGGVKDAALNDDDLAKIKLWLGCRWGFEPSANTIGDALTILATNNSFDPALDFLNGLPKWDEVERLDSWLANNFEATGHPSYLAQVFRKWMVAMVMRIEKPGAKFDWMPIFEGPQGVGKSSFGRILVGDKYFLDWLPPLDNKDSALSLQGVWAVEMGELASFRKNEIETVKAFITRTVDKVRPPYGQRWLESARRCVFFGTTNFETYLRDDSGNRRFKPVKVGKLNFDQLIEDREQLFAEAVYLYRHGFEVEQSLDITGEARLYELLIQNEKMVADDSALMAEAIIDFIEAEKLKDFDRQFSFDKFRLKELFKPTNISQGIGPLENWKFDSRTAQLAAKALKAVRGEKFKSNGGVYWKINF